MQKKIQYVLLGALIISFTGNLISLLILDRAIHYRNYIRYIETLFPNEGLHLADSKQIQSADVSPLGAFVGGSLLRYWFLSSDFSYPITNWGGIEEKCSTTLKRFNQTVIQTGADFVLINAGFCDLVTSVRAGRSVPDAISSNIACLEQIAETAETNHVIPILTTLTPVRPRFLFSHLKAVDYASKQKIAENKAIQAYNRLIRDLSQQKNIPLIDFHAALADDSGGLIKKYAISDGEHINHDGYAYLNRFLEKELNRIFPKAYENGTS